MHLNDNTVPGNYQQPIKNFTGRIVSNNVEEIDFAPNSNVRIWYNNRAEDYPLHKHSILEIAIPTEGSYSYVFEDRTIVLNEKDILIVPPDTLHKISGTRAGIRIIFLFNIDFMKGFFDYAELKALLSEPIVINETTYPDLYNPIYSKLIAISDLYFFYTSSIKEIPIFSNLLAVFGMLLKTEYEQDILVSQNDKQRDIYIKFKGLTERLSLHYADNISMEEAANYVGYSKFHFARLFKEYSGMTYYDYQTSLKIKAVVEMLSETDLQISEIALRCGFNNLTSLSRNFKKQYGCSPSTYRHKLRRKKDL